MPKIFCHSHGLHLPPVNLGHYPIVAQDNLEASFAPEVYPRLRAFEYIGVHTCFVRPWMACGSIHQRCTYWK